MSALESRTLAKAALAPLNIPIKFRGETLPQSGPHIVLDLISATPLTTLELSEAGTFTLLQVSAWARLLSAALTLEQLAHALLEQNGFYRRVTRYPSEEGWEGAQSDYDILS